jgi:hypothetical protein
MKGIKEVVNTNGSHITVKLTKEQENAGKTFNGTVVTK